ncbi:MAG: hypothetical protein EXR15_05010 [Chitinophagaceae bacterium]|nr:hypothetical protein [Chitinophagaceae bacterium]
MGVKKFNSLDRKKLILLTTFEPCPMCKGAIQEYKINNVIFNLAKGEKEKIIYFKNDIKYYFNLRQTKNKRLQYDLFKLHPDFDSIKYPY